MIDDKTPFLKKERGFLFWGIGKLDRWQKARPDLGFTVTLLDELLSGGEIR